MAAMVRKAGPVKMPTFRADRQSGFTLLELLAVLAIIALSATAVVQLGRSSSETAKVRFFLVEAEAMMRQARATAIETTSVQDVIIDTEARRLVYAGGADVLEVPKAVSLNGKLARVPERDGSGFVVRFFPSGGSTGAHLPFLYRGQTFVLRVNWLTGHADVRRG